MKCIYLVFLCLIIFVYCEEVCLNGECNEVEVRVKTMELNMPMDIIPSGPFTEQSTFNHCVKPDDWEEELDGEWDPDCLHSEISTPSWRDDMPGMQNRLSNAPTTTTFILNLPEDWISLQNQVKELREGIVSLKTMLADQERRLWIQQFFGDRMMALLNDTVLDQFAELAEKMQF